MKSPSAYQWLTAPLMLFPQALSASFTTELTVFTRKGKIYISPNDIVRVEAQGAYSWLYTTSRQSYLISGNLAKLTSRLPGFVRVHKSHLINPAYVVGEIHRNGQKPAQRYVRLSTGETVPLSQRIKVKVS